MKTPKEWVIDFMKRDFNGPTPAVMKCFEYLFEEIQTDARRQGMMDAKALACAEALTDDTGHPEDHAYNRAIKDAAEAIQTAADNLK